MSNFQYYEEIVSGGGQAILDTIVKHIEDIQNLQSGNYTRLSSEPSGNVDATCQWRVLKKVYNSGGTHLSEVVLATVTSNQVSQATPLSLVLGPTVNSSGVWTPGNPLPDVNSGAMVFMHLKYRGSDTPAKHSQIDIQMYGNYDGSSATPTITDISPTCSYIWADQSIAQATTDRDITKPVYMYLHLSNNKMAMILAADPAVNFTDYRKSFMYFGALKQFKYNQGEMDKNIMLTCGSVGAEGTPDVSYGQFTSIAQNSIMMYKTKSGIRFQRHYPAFITQAPDPINAYNNPSLPAYNDITTYAPTGSTFGNTGLHLEPQGFNASQWTKKYHLSPIYVVHPYDGYRGMLEDVISVSKNNILHLDELLVDIDPGSDPLKNWKQETYKYFDHNSENNFMNRSANIKMGLGFLTNLSY